MKSAGKLIIRQLVRSHTYRCRAGGTDDGMEAAVGGALFLSASVCAHIALRPSVCLRARLDF